MKTLLLAAVAYGLTAAVLLIVLASGFHAGEVLL
jgi:hypothetical protein